MVDLSIVMLNYQRVPVPEIKRGWEIPELTQWRFLAGKLLERSGGFPSWN